AGREDLALIVFKGRAMERVRSRPAEHVDLAAGRAAVFGRQNTLRDLDFRDGFDAHHADLILTAVGSGSSRLGIGDSVRPVNRDRGSTFGDAVQPDVAAAGN